MNPKLQVIANNIEQAPGLTDAEKQLLLQFINDADKKQALDKFKLDRLEHDKHTLSIMLEESIQDLQKKSSAIEEQNRELEIESSLEKVRTVAMGMRKRDDMLDICRTISQQLELLGIKEIRNVQTAIFHQNKGTYVNYEYYRLHDKALVTEVDYTKDELSIDFAAQMIKGGEEIFTRHLEGDQVREWLKIQKNTNVFIDTHLETVSSLTYQWFSLGPVAIGISTYAPLSEDEITLFKRFRNVFDLAYRRYLDIEKAEAQAREAQIEAALEKVRSRSLAMHRTDELKEVVAVLFEKLKDLGIILDGGAGVTLFTEGTMDTVLYIASPNFISEPMRVVTPCTEADLGEYLWLSDLWNAKKTGEDIFNRSYSREVKNKLFQHIFPYNEIPEAVREFMLNADSHTTSGAMGKYSFLAIDSWVGATLSEEQFSVLKRMGKVFEQAYIRFLDLQKAEAQTRESQIQLALERVRARTMAMQKSDELSEAVFVLFQQFKDLGERPDQATIGVVNEDEQVIEYWVTMYGSQMDRVFKFSINEPHVTNKIYKAWKEQKKSLVIDLSGQDLVEFTKYRESMGGAKHNPEEKRRIINVAFFSKGLLNVQSSERRSEESVRLLERFASVFDQTYTRFLDLQKAEAQVRESQIQLALERVRARTMAMQHSNEHTDAAMLMFKQLEELGVNAFACGFVILDKDDTEGEFWMSSEGVFQPPHYIPHMEEPSVRNIYLHWKTGAESYAEDVGGEALKSHYKYLISLPKSGSNFQGLLDAGITFPEWQRMYAAYFSHGYLLIITKERYKEEAIFIRFAKVFEQTYTRFLDLQRAEAQTRESQIQLALERVRARTMAMQKSDELPETAAILFEQFKSLGQELMQMTIGVVNEAEGVIEFSVTDWSGGGTGVNRAFNLSIEEPTLIKKMYAGWKENRKSIVVDLTGKQLEGWINYRNKMSGVTVNSADTGGRRVITSAFFSKGHLSFSTAVLPATESIQILERFAQVFDLTYTRFLDLKKAEAQTRESQIQLALERVRARTMAMQHSDELKSAATLLFQQAKSLGVPAYSCGYNIWEENEKVFTSWMSTQDGTDINAVLNIPLTEDANFIRFAQSRKKNEPFFVLELRGERMQEHYRYLKTIPEFKAYFDYAVSAGFALPETQIHHIANFSHGNLLFITLEPCPEFHDLFKRFAAVFDQTYTRFLDLQTAEAQARESQIQLALERVRARTMAMQKSDELAELMLTIFKSITSLGIEDDDVEVCYITTFDPVKPIGELYLAKFSRFIPGSYMLPYDEEPLFKAIYQHWRNGESFYVGHLQGQRLHDHFEYMRTHTSLPAVQTEEEVTSQLKETFTHALYFSQGYLAIVTRQPVESFHPVFKRFGNVLQQTYTRFLDLQRAETQARESQIQLALERVRARTMAMQKSDELNEVASLLFKQVSELGIKLWTTGFNVWSNDNNSWLDYVTDPQGDFMEPYTVDATEFSVMIEVADARKRGDEFFVNCVEGQTIKDMYEQLRKFAHNKQFDKLLEAGFQFPSKQYNHFVFGSKTSLLFITYEPMPEAHDIFKRFGKVFEQTYTRFLDLQKAEAQAREAQIEAALEKVRSRSLAMRHSDELREVIAMVYIMLSELKVKHDTIAIQVFDFDTKSSVLWPRNTLQNVAPKVVFPYDEGMMREDTPHRALWEAMATGKSIINKVYSKQQKDRWFEYIFAHNDYTVVEEHSREFLLQLEILTVCFFPEKYSGLYAESWDGTKYSEEEIDVLKRAARVFEQAYTRFLDLQKAEAQARESQIQLALERARAQSMMMQHSKELDDTLRVFHEQVLQLNIPSAFSFLWLPDEEKDRHIFWAAWAENNSTLFKSKSINYPLDRKEPATAQCLVDWKSNQPVVSYHVPPEGVENYFAAWRELIAGVEQLKPEYFREGLYYVEAFIKYGCFGVMVKTELTEDEKKILYRFAVEFERTYTRFLDLQKAEAQARDAQIEAGLERVRSRTMGMQHSNELQDASSIMFEQIQALGVLQFACGFNIWDEDRKAATAWMSGDNRIQPSFKTSSSEDIFLDIYAAAQRGESLFIKEQKGDQLETHYKYMATIPGFKDIVERMSQAGFSVPSFQIMHCAFFSQGYLMFITYEPVPQMHDIFKRFAKVFEQTYTRFLDLQKAEANAREAQVEAALEKVRSRSLAMHRSDELQEVVQLVFEKLKELNVDFYTVIIVIFQEDSKDIIWWMTNIVSQQYPKVLISYSDIPYMRDLFEARQGGKDLFSKCYVNDEKKKVYTYLLEDTALKRVPEQQKKFLLEAEFATMSVAFAKNTGIHITSYSKTSFSEEENDILKRFATVFDQAYTRFIDLQKAEAQAREAQIEAALEKVRSRTLAMQKSDELAETASVLFKQLIHLGIEPNRLYINIIRDETGDAEFWITDEDGSKIAMAYTINMNTNPSFKTMYDGWKAQKRSLVMEMQGKELQQYLEFLSSMNVPFKGGLLQKRRVQYLAYFNKGFIGMASPEEQPAETLQLLERFAAVFNLTFTRFNDLKIAEAHALQAEQDLVEIKAAKKKAEDTLTELQAAQKQLVQSEKMASLGELTAGIAHEIQNPLNFVNNFSDVSNELLEEMKVELEKGNKTDVIAIVDDVKQNLEKILYHGKRADSIVKGMLQHSRTSSGQKEVTDINALTDEYLRLAYHGLRAKDKSFNAKFITEFDANVGKISVIPQEIGRVILNLINNAFYAVTEKKKQSGNGYEPMVTISTKRSVSSGEGGGEVLISIADNGGGIPQKNLDKIFQPFFTTKPTGQGTGLGLSLAYDIVKAHGGEIKIETKENEGSNFIVELPNQ